MCRERERQKGRVGEDTQAVFNDMSDRRGIIWKREGGSGSGTAPWLTDCPEWRFFFFFF